MGSWMEVARVIAVEVSRMAWFTLLGISIAALIKTYQLDRKVRQYVVRAGLWGILVATAVGVFSPLCSCGILPVIIPMALSGVPLAPLMALLIVSPIMDPTSFTLTWGGVGEALAWWKFGGAVAIGLIAGLTTLALERVGFLRHDLIRLQPVFSTDGKLAPAYEITCNNGFRVRTMQVVERETRWRFFLDRFRDVGVFVAAWVLLAIVLEALIQVFVPIQWVTWLVGQKGPLSVITAALVALPLPAHQIPIIPILAGLQAKGMAEGADLAFLLAGPVTSIPATVALTAIFRLRVVFIFLGCGLIGSMALGLLRMGLTPLP